MNYYTKEEIDLARKSAQLVGKTHGEISKLIKPGVTTLELDKAAEYFIRSNGGVPAFLGYAGFPRTLCTSINEEVVHGIPGNRELMDGDIISVDCGVLMNGFYGDSAYTYTVGEVSDELKELLKVTEECLYLGIENAIVGNRIGDIGYAIQQHAEKYGYGVIRDYIGHGVGRNLHEAPDIPNFGKRGSGKKLKEGMIIAIEPMVNLGSKSVSLQEDLWTVSTNDKKPSAHFEHTLTVGKDKAEILSSFDYIEK